MGEWPWVRIQIRRLSKNGIGRPWVAEVEGDGRKGFSDPINFVHGSKRGDGYLVYRLDPAKTYLRQEPYWKQSDGHTPLAEDDQIGARRFVFCVSPWGAVVDLEEVLGFAESSYREQHRVG